MVQSISNLSTNKKSILGGNTRVKTNRNLGDLLSKNVAITPTGQVGTPTQNIAPTTNYGQPQTTSQYGSYKGVPITSNNPAEIARIIKGIDNPVQKTTTSNGLVTTPQTRNVQTRDDTVKGLFTDVISSLAKRGTEPSKSVEEAQKKYQKAVTDIAQFEKDAAQGLLPIYDDPVSARIMSAREGQKSAILEGQRAKLQEKATQAQNLITQAQTQQQLEQQALQQAAGLAQPSVTQYGQTVFNPLTGTFQGGSTLEPSVVANQLAQDVVSGRKTYDQAVASLGYAGGAGQQFLNNALSAISPTFNIPQATATIGGQAGVLGQLPALESADVAAEGIKDKITTYLASNPQLNPSALAVGNVLQQWVQGKQLSDPKYQTLFNYLNEYTNTLAPILGVGGDATNLKTQIAQSFVNAAASGQSIAEVLENIQGLSRGKIEDIRSGAVGGGVVSSPQTSGSGGGGLFDW